MRLVRRFAIVILLPENVLRGRRLSVASRCCSLVSGTSERAGIAQNEGAASGSSTTCTNSCSMLSMSPLSPLVGGSVMSNEGSRSATGGRNT